MAEGRQLRDREPPAFFVRESIAFGPVSNRSELLWPTGIVAVKYIGSPGNGYKKRKQEGRQHRKQSDCEHSDTPITQSPIIVA